MLGFYTGVRYHPQDLRRAFFSTRFVRVLDPLGYARIMNWRVYGEEALAKRGVALWLGSDVLAIEYAGEMLSRYEVEYQPGGELGAVRRPELLESAYRSRQPRLFRLDEALGDGWLKALKLDGYAPRIPRGCRSLQQVLFAHTDAL